MAFCPTKELLSAMWEAKAMCPGNLSSHYRCERWHEEYFALERRGYSAMNDARVFSRVKDLLCGYATIWISLFVVRLCLFFRKISLRKALCSLRHFPVDVWSSLRRTDSQVNTLKTFHESGCPVCLSSTEELRDKAAIVGICGHVLCAECFTAMWSHGKMLLYPISCPLCTTPIFQVSPIVSASAPIDENDPTTITLDKSIRRYNIIFSGSRVGLIKTRRADEFWMTCADIAESTAGVLLRAGYFFVTFDKKMLNTISFFMVHLCIAISVEYVENMYFGDLFDEDF